MGATLRVGKHSEEVVRPNLVEHLLQQVLGVVGVVGGLIIVVRLGGSLPPHAVSTYAIDATAKSATASPESRLPGRRPSPLLGSGSLNVA